MPCGRSYFGSRRIGHWSAAFLFRWHLFCDALLLLENLLDRWAIVVEVLKNPLGVVMSGLNLFRCDYTPFVVQYVVAQDPNV